MTDFSDCTCGRIFVGQMVTENRNWNPDCVEHGTTSEWWNSDEQREKRRLRNERSESLRQQAREARRQARS